MFLWQNTLFFYILDVEVYFLEPCLGVKTRTLLVDARQVSVAQDHGIGKSRQMLLSSSSIVIFWARVRVSAVLHVGDDVLLIARAAQRAAMHQLRAKLIVGAANGKALFGHIALEGAQVLAVGGLKLVQADVTLAGMGLLHVLVQIVARAVVGIIVG